MKLTGVNEETLWNNVIAGDQQAFRVLYEASADMLYAYALRYFPDKEMIMDSIHDLFTDLYLQRSNLARQVNIRFYLLVSFRRKLNASLKKNARFSLQADMTRAESYFQLTFEANDAQSRIIAEEEQQGALRRLAAEMNKLPARQKEILYLKYNCELSYEEVAQLMQISVPTCRTLAYRAIRQLRQDMPVTTIPAFSMLLFTCLKNF
ncbi:sigma-70 family RNA polymerase sigma factor [Chitinophaga oryzae]|uniref:Sigma-70 family RNA polymerase sigma factor n=1 Tax=Chitinophaga oryzae TaxID=2725414 RepID=A0AAE6ZGR5_9BACT|nr:sigma-70 family RNA polymerase sigma factor [Chitinophaga oryzae]QJB32723.1 sigma-70 family RNA polymerase sigma factor [Chitinophaga oryzae]QJB39175.1 sigma-70 family RNA polymerase sigma factor [Chitinophaga oryzae]